MTISTTSSTAVVQGNGLTTSFSFSFPVPSLSDLYVFLNELSGAVTLIPQTQYTVTGIGSPNGGSVNYPLVGSPIPTGTSLMILRQVPYQQLTSLVNQSGYYPDVVEAALDNLTLQTQQLSDAVDLTLKVPLAATQANLTLPSAAGRALTVVGFDENGNATTYPVPASVGAGNLTSEGPFVSGVGFTPGVTTTLTLSQNYGSPANVAVHFDGAYQGTDQYSILGNQIIFTSPIPVGTAKVYVVGGTTLSAYIPAIGSVGPDQLQPGAVEDVAVSITSALYRRVVDLNNVKDPSFGAVGNGSINDVAAFTSCDLAGIGTFVPNGNYYIGTNLTMTGRVIFADGAKITVPNGVTVNFAGGVNAPLQQIFALSGTGTVVINHQVTGVGYPEWWGAQSNNSGHDSLSAMVACINAMRFTQLQAADYYISDTLKIVNPHKDLAGMGFDDEVINGTVTRILVTNGTSSGIQMGPDTQPATINDFIKEIRVSNLLIARTVAPVISSDCVGLKNQFTLFSYVDRVKSSESMKQFNIYSVVNSHYTDCFAFRSTNGTGAGTDYSHGFFLDGTNHIGSGGNASLYMRDCDAGTGGLSISTSVGYTLQDTWADTWITNGEVAACAIGYEFSGNTSTTLNANHLDCHIVNPVVDGFTIAGIYFNGTNEYGQITITGGYAAPAATGIPSACIWYNNSKAMIKAQGFQCVCMTNPSAAGIFATFSYNISSSCMIGESGNIPIVLGAVSNCRFDDDIRNYSVTSAGPAVQGTTVSRNKFNVTVSGKANAYTMGYQTLTSSDYNEMNVTGIDSGAITGGAANKFVRLGVQQTAVGLNGTTDYTQGVVA